MAWKTQGEIGQNAGRNKASLQKEEGHSVGVYTASATEQAEGRQPELLGCFRLPPICCSAACLQPAPSPSLSLKQRAIWCISPLGPQPSSLPESEQPSKKEAHVGPRGQEEKVKAL